MKKPAGKNVFLAVLIIATIAHLLFLTTEYIRCSEVEHVKLEQQDSKIFPSVTLCSSVPIKRKLDSKWNIAEWDMFANEYAREYYIPHYDIIYKANIKLPKNITTGADDEYLDIEEITKKNELEILSRLAKYNSSDRLRYAAFPDIMINLFYNSESNQGGFDVTDWSHHVFNNLYYGNCVTFNFAKMLSKRKHVNVNSVGFDANIELFRNGYNSDKISSVASDEPSESNVMVIHEPYTQPIFDSKNVIKIRPYIDNDFNHDINCQPRNDVKPEMQSTDMFYTEEQYIYSFETCVASCLQNLTMKYCQCQLPQFYADSQLPACRICRKIPEHELQQQCDCKVPCKYSKFNYILAEKSSFKNNEYYENLYHENSFLSLEGDMHSLDFRDRWLSQVTNTMVTLTKASQVVSVVHSTPECMFEIVLSQVGGILGVYVGLSILTMVESIGNWMEKCFNKNSQPFEERQTLGPKAESYIKSCYYWNNQKKYHCRSDIEFTMGKLGNCATINAGLLNDIDKHPINSTELFLELEYIGSQSRTLVDKIGLSVFIHPRGTSPNMEPKEMACVVTPNAKFTLTFSAAEKRHLPSPFPSQCISELSPEYLWTNIFYDHHRQYKHTLESCLASDRFNQTVVNPCMMYKFDPDLQGRIFIDDYDNTIIDSINRHCLLNVTFPPFHCAIPCNEMKYVVEEFRKTPFYQSKNESNVAHHFDDDSYFQEESITNEYPPSLLSIRPTKMVTTVMKEVAAIEIVKFYSTDSVMKKPAGKSFFLAVLIIATIAHLIFVTTEYIRCSEVQHVKLEQQDSQTFPSVTLCSNVPIKRKLDNLWEIAELDLFMHEYDLPNFDMMFKDYIKLPEHITTGANDEYLDIEEITKKNELEILSRLAKYNSSDRLRYAAFPDIVMNLFYNSESNQGGFDVADWSHHVFNNLYYGNCVTFNFAKMLSKKKLVNVNSVGFDAKIQFFRNGYKSDKNSSVEFDEPSETNVMVIHEPYTQPIFDSRNVIKISPYIDVSAIITMNDFNHDINCQPRNDVKPEMQSTDMFYTEEQYIYSFETCVASCLQNLTIKYCQCQLPQFYADSQLPACRICRKIPKHELQQQCDCKVPCKYSKFNYILAEKSSFKNNEYYEDLYLENSFLSLEGDMLSLDFRDRWLSLVTDTMVTLTKASHVVAVFEIVLSQVGGILGVYVGLSILTMVESIGNWMEKCFNKNRSNESKLSPLKNNSVKNEKFIERSSISAVILALASTSRLKRLIWISLLTIALYKTYEQGKQLLENFIQYPVVETTEKISQMEFPAVTICSNVVFSQTASKEAKQKLYDRFDGSLEHYMYLTDFFSYIFSQPFEERQSLGPKAESYIKSCYYWINQRKYHCRSDIEFTMGKLGNCATINAGLLNDIDKHPINSTELFLELEYIGSQSRTLVDKIGLSVFIHPRGTSPNMEPKEMACVVTPNAKFTLTFSATEKRHLPSPYPSQCISELSPEYQWANIFHNHHRQYKHTLEGCLASDRFNQTVVNPCMKYKFNPDLQGRLFIDDYDNTIIDSNRLCLFNVTFPSFPCAIPCNEMKYVVEEFRKAPIYQSKYESNVAHNFDNDSYFQEESITNEYPPSLLSIRPTKMVTAVIKEVAAIEVNKSLLHSIRRF
ncbi:hypothetical protein CHUAL_002209 [Chamberlinius hualienensis]